MGSLEEDIKKMEVALKAFDTLEEELEEFFKDKGVDDYLGMAGTYVDDMYLNAIMYNETVQHRPLHKFVVKGTEEETSWLTHAVKVAMGYGFLMGVKHGMEREGFNKLDIPDIDL